MIYHKICDLESCKQPFETTMKRKKFHCDDCYKKANLVRNRIERYAENKTLYQCPDCGKMTSNKKHCFCDKCKYQHSLKGISTLTGNEIYF